MDVMHKLATTKLLIPSGLKRYVKENYKKIERSNQSLYVNSLEIWHERLLLRTFAFNRYGDIKEICRRLEGERKVLLDSVENTMYAGRLVYYDNLYNIRDLKNCYWDVKYYEHNIYTGNIKSWWFYGKNLYDETKWIEKLNIQYCGWGKYKIKMLFFEYICLYRKYPKIELLVKAGYENYLTGLRYLDINQKTIDKIFKVNKKWVPHLKQLNVDDLLIIRRYEWINDLHDLSKVKQVMSETSIKMIRKYLSKSMICYFDEKGFMIAYRYMLKYYDDYLRFAEEIGLDMQNKQVLYPKDIEEAHDKAFERTKIIKSERIDKGIRKTAEKLKKYSFENGELIIRPALSNEELINESKVLSHCVRTYAEKVAEGKTGIMFIRKREDADHPYVTLEIKNKKITQVRGYKNNMTEPLDKKVKLFIKEWEREFNLEGF